MPNNFSNILAELKTLQKTIQDKSKTKFTTIWSLWTQRPADHSNPEVLKNATKQAIEQLKSIVTEIESDIKTTLSNIQQQSRKYNKTLKNRVAKPINHRKRSTPTKKQSVKKSTKGLNS